jgi:NAD(P)H-nitrite reductase large subunit
MNKHVVIIGNGISGITCARTIRKLSDHRITVISAESDHFFSRTALMYIYMGHMKYEHTKPYEDGFWEKNRIELLKKYVERVDTSSRRLHFSDGASLNYDTLVVASGSKYNKFGWPGQDLHGVQGMYSLQDLQAMETNTENIQRAVIVGGGLIGVEMAEMLLSRKIPVTFLVREKNFWDIILPEEEAKLVGRHIAEHGIDLRLETELKEIIGDAQGRASAVITNKGDEIACQFVGLTVGVSPNIGFLTNSGIETNRGVLVNEYFETNVPGVYAVGDCAQFRQALPGRRPIEQVWYTGRMHGETVAQTICGGRRSYDPGLWFNSAKFFDIEYQTYGDVPNILREVESSFYWEHPAGKICLRIVYSKNDRSVRGFNVMGLRLRHRVCERWINEKRTLDYVVEHLNEANFDPEFFRKHEPAILDYYQRAYSSEGVTV